MCEFCTGVPILRRTDLPEDQLRSCEWQIRSPASGALETCDQPAVWILTLGGLCEHCCPDHLNEPHYYSGEARSIPDGTPCDDCGHQASHIYIAGIPYHVCQEHADDERGLYEARLRAMGADVLRFRIKASSLKAQASSRKAELEAGKSSLETQLRDLRQKIADLRLQLGED